MNWIIDNWIEITAVIGSVVTAASLIVKLTPTPKDDAILAKIIAILNLFALNPKTRK